MKIIIEVKDTATTKDIEEFYNALCTLLENEFNQVTDIENVGVAI